MKNMIRKIAVMTLSVVLIANTGCTSLQTIEGTKAAVVQHKLKVGDKVRIRYLDYRTEDVRILKLTESELTATRRDGTVVVVDWHDVYVVEVKKIHPVKTAGAVVGGVVVTAALAVLLLLAAFAGFTGA